MKLSGLSESQVWLAERAPTGFLVALWLDPDTATALALPGGESTDSLHISLAFCGDASEMDELVQARVITAIDETVRYRDKLEGTISGYGRFGDPDNEVDPHVFYASPDVPRLAELRQCIVDCLMDKGVSVATEHGFTPHITLAYLDPGDPNPVSEIEALPLTFESVTVMSGTRRIDIPFYAPEPPYSLSESTELSEEAPLDARPARALYFGSFDKEWIPYLPKPGKYVHEIFGNLDFTPSTYDDILRNFDNYVYKQDLPIRATHTDPAAGAVGWIRPGGMRLAEDGSLEVKPEWNELGKGLVKDDRFLYTSAEFCKFWTNPVTQERIPNVAVGLALVTRPHFKTDVLNPLSEGEALAFGEFAESHKARETSKAGDAREGNPMPEEVKLEDKKVETPVVVQTPEALKPIVLSSLTEVVITAEQRQQERQMFADLTARAELAERRATTAETRAAQIEQERRVEKFTAEVIGRSPENGQPWFGNPRENVEHLVSLAEKYGDDSAEIRWAVTQKRNEASAIRKTGIFDPIAVGSSGNGVSVNAQVNHLADQARLVNPKLTQDQAIVQVYSEHPELYSESIKSR